MLSNFDLGLTVSLCFGQQDVRAPHIQLANLLREDRNALTVEESN